MARYAVISDIHGNLHALHAVLGRIEQLDVEEIICLGDIVGYGPFPGFCTDMVFQRCSTVVLGNHDEALWDTSICAGFNNIARAAIHWTRDVIQPSQHKKLRSLQPIQYVQGAIMCAHDTPVCGSGAYINNPQAAADAFSGVDAAVCLIGHTHVPMIFAAESLDPSDPVGPADLVCARPVEDEPYELDLCKRYICNPGSVGQPRDADPRASFGVIDLDQSTFTVHREPYDIAATQHATARAGLPTILADRLSVGA